MYTISSATHPTARPKEVPPSSCSSSNSQQHLLLGLLLAALCLGCSSELLGSVLALLACPCTLVVAPLCKSAMFLETYAAVCWPSRPSFPSCIAPIYSLAQISSMPRASRRRERNRLTFHHRIVFGNRRRRRRPYWPCTFRRALIGAHPWRRLVGLGGGHRCAEVRNLAWGFRDRISLTQPSASFRGEGCG
jgi:hypothetical protein